MVVSGHQKQLLQWSYSGSHHTIVVTIVVIIKYILNPDDHEYLILFVILKIILEMSKLITQTVVFPSL